jgi:hypothetical protein
MSVLKEVRPNHLSRKPLEFTSNQPDLDILHPHLLGQEFRSSASPHRLSSHLDPVAEYDAVPDSALVNGDAIEEMLSSMGNRNEPLPNPYISDGTSPDDPWDAVGGFENKHQDHTIALLNDLALRAPFPEPASDLSTPTYNSNVRVNADMTFINNEEDEDAVDEEKASKYVEHLLAQLISKEKGKPPARQSESNSFVASSRSSLEDDDRSLDARFAALNLPSVPDLLPGNRVQRNGGDDAEPRCCCICFDTPATKCLDCEGSQLFCMRCWSEMHIDSADANYSSANHRKVSLRDR